MKMQSKDYRKKDALVSFVFACAFTTLTAMLIFAPYLIHMDFTGKIYVPCFFVILTSFGVYAIRRSWNVWHMTVRIDEQGVSVLGPGRQTLTLAWNDFGKITAKSTVLWDRNGNRKIAVGLEVPFGKNPGVLVEIRDHICREYLSRMPLPTFPFTYESKRKVMIMRARTMVSIVAAFACFFLNFHHWPGINFLAASFGTIAFVGIGNLFLYNKVELTSSGISLFTMFGKKTDIIWKNIASIVRPKPAALSPMFIETKQGVMYKISVLVGDTLYLSLLSDKCLSEFG